MITYGPVKILFFVFVHLVSSLRHLVMVVCRAHGRVARTVVKRFGVASTTALAIPDSAAAAAWQRIHTSRIRAMRNEREWVRALSSKLDLDGLMSANRWGGGGKTATARPADPSADSNPLDALMNKNKYGGRKKEKESEHDGALVNYGECLISRSNDE